jgi:hypothetical protein
VEFCLLVVHSVQQVFEVWDLAFGGHEVG